ncbi:hypothetical protein M0813_23932 [Anaeramoeba flamelloides]|uniref:Uncharacterized protein n=1 Tax=Anaeramoeba flamelloides TaxID=1746091 RepID=A0ABQ8Y8B2_9EUKA|nr:hypothetical protein M0813_23932 [Anaeramoeba flamelloides]
MDDLPLKRFFIRYRKKILTHELFKSYLMANCCQEMKHTQVILQDLSNFISEKSNEEDRDQKIDKFMIYNVSLVLNRKIELFALRKKISEKAQQLGQLTNTKFEEFKNQFKNFKISEEKIIKKEVTSSDFANESEVVGEEQDNSDDVNFKRKPEFVKENYFEQKKRRRKKKRKKKFSQKKKGSSKRNRAIEKKKSRKRRLKIRNKNSSSSLNSLSDQSSHSKTDIQEETSSENYSDISSNTDSEDLKHFKRKEKIIMKEKGEKKGKQKQNDQKKEKLKIKKKKNKNKDKYFPQEKLNRKFKEKHKLKEIKNTNSQNYSSPISEGKKKKIKINFQIQNNRQQKKTSQNKEDNLDEDENFTFGYEEESEEEEH